MNKIHELKSQKHLFDAIISGEKKHELRNNDRNFQVGDMLVLNEYDHLNKEYTGRKCVARVTYITSTENTCALSDIALHPNFCILSIGSVFHSEAL